MITSWSSITFSQDFVPSYAHMQVNTVNLNYVINLNSMQLFFFLILLLIIHYAHINTNEAITLPAREEVGYDLLPTNIPAIRALTSSNKYFCCLPTK